MSYNKSDVSAMLSKHLCQSVLIAGMLVGGATLVAGSARATTWSSICSFGPTYTANPTACTGSSGAGWITSPPGPPFAPGNPPLQLGDKLLSIASYSFTDYSTGLLTNPSGEFEFSVQEGPAGCSDSRWGVRTIFDNSVTGVVGQNATGILNYNLSIVPSLNAECNFFESIRIDSAAVGTGTTVTKSIDGLISPYLISNEGSISSGPLGGTSINVTDTYSVTETGQLITFVNEYTQTNDVPGPLPLFGAGAAFGFSRRLRSRIKGSRLV